MATRCWCGNDNLEEYSQHYYKCPQCNTLISKNNFNNDIYHVVDEDSDLYGKNYWESMMEKQTQQSSLNEIVDTYFNDRIAYWLKYILKYIPVSYRIAEIGCGLGQLAYAMKVLGYNQTAYEMSPEICKFIAKTLDINVICGEFQNYADKYDAVLAFDLIEHIIEPEMLLNNIYARLGDEGVLCIQTPCYDETLTYGQMCLEKPRFIEQLKEEQIYLYSRQSMMQLLEKVGFKQFYFEPACFGDDYDMFLFAAKKPILVKTEEEISAELDSLQCGRIVKSYIFLYDQKRKLEDALKESDIDRNNRLESIYALQKRLEESEAECAARLSAMNELERLLKESEADRAARLSAMNELERLLKESEAEKAALLNN